MFPIIYNNFLDITMIEYVAFGKKAYNINLPDDISLETKIDLQYEILLLEPLPNPQMLDSNYEFSNEQKQEINKLLEFPHQTIAPDQLLQKLFSVEQLELMDGLIGIRKLLWQDQDSIDKTIGLVTLKHFNIIFKILSESKNPKIQEESLMILIKLVKNKIPFSKSRSFGQEEVPIIVDVLQNASPNIYKLCLNLLCDMCLINYHSADYIARLLGFYKFLKSQHVKMAQQFNSQKTLARLLCLLCQYGMFNHREKFVQIYFFMSFIIADNLLPYQIDHYIMTIPILKALLTAKYCIVLNRDRQNTFYFPILLKLLPSIIKISRSNDILFLSSRLLVYLLEPFYPWNSKFNSAAISERKIYFTVEVLLSKEKIALQIEGVRILDRAMGIQMIKIVSRIKETTIQRMLQILPQIADNQVKEMIFSIISKILRQREDMIKFERFLIQQKLVVGYFGTFRHKLTQKALEGIYKIISFKCPKYPQLYEEKVTRTTIYNDDFDINSIRNLENHQEYGRIVKRLLPIIKWGQKPEQRLYKYRIPLKN